MAIFASTTLGASDPSKAMSIKALEARAQALQAAQAKQEMPTSLPSPWQGVSLVANQAADAFTARRADQAAAQRRQDLAGYISRAGDNPTMADVGQITAADTDVGKAYLSEIQQRRQQAAQIQAAKELAAQKAQQDQEYLTKQEQLQGGRPQTDVAKIRADEKAGRISKEEADAAVRQSTAPPAGQQKTINEQEDLNAELQSNLAGLHRAQELLKSGNVYSGGGAEMREKAGKFVPDALGGFAGISSEKTKATQEYNQIMSPQVLDVLNKLKGASSDRDMNFAIDTLNDKSATPEAKQAALERLLPKVAAHLELNQRRLKEMGREPVKVNTPAPATALPTAGGGDDANAAARAWLAANPNDPRAEAVRKKLEGR
jgi:hypothetical protein